MKMFHPNDYMERCPYCKQYLLASQIKQHVCNAPLIDVREIPVLFSYETSDINGERVIIARGYDGVLYRLVKTKNPLNRRKVTDSGTDEDVPVPCDCTVNSRSHRRISR
jgi:hypothetical protein